ncbi:hypothetical protein PR202_gb06230 [Eleusine coracana subsp. coracana]|uniref:Uncharacterized protein n=1 Tax=Eleusine coracana subsp. coracana TaxID=191504 RepID=A0AAV5E6K7_ELECO|nr:hypothetical protein PR202_gb06230 [Eleusine coracana subsp. coracana]
MASRLGFARRRMVGNGAHDGERSSHRWRQPKPSLAILKPPRTTGDRRRAEAAPAATSWLRLHSTEAPTREKVDCTSVRQAGRAAGV